MRRDTLSLEGSLAGIFHMHRNVPENYPVIVYVILSGLESTAKAYMPCATLGWMSEMFFMGIGNMTKELRGDQKPCGKALESRQGAQIVLEMEPHTQLLSTETYPRCTHKQ